MADIDAAINTKNGTKNPGGLESMNSATLSVADTWTFRAGDEILLVSTGTDTVTLKAEPGAQNRDVDGVFSMTVGEVVLIGPLKADGWKDASGDGNLTCANGAIVEAYIFRKY